MMFRSFFRVLIICTETGVIENMYRVCAFELSQEHARVGSGDAEHFIQEGGEIDFGGRF